MLAESVLRDMRASIDKAENIALVALERDLKAATRDRNLDGVLAIKSKIQELRSTTSTPSLQVSALPYSSQTALREMQAAIQAAEAKAVEALEKQMIRHGDANAALAIRTQIESIRSGLSLSMAKDSVAGAFACDRRTLDEKLRITGGQGPTNGSWLSDRWIVADNRGSSPQAVTHGSYTAINDWHGERLVLFVHPASETLPGFVDFSDVVKGVSGTLIIKMRNHPGGDSKATLMVDGKDVRTFDLSGDKWFTARVKTDSSSIMLRVEATGWYCEHCLFTYDIVP